MAECSPRRSKCKNFSHDVIIGPLLSRGRTTVATEFARTAGLAYHRPCALGDVAHQTRTGCWGFLLASTFSFFDGLSDVGNISFASR